MNHLYTNKKWHVKQERIQIAEPMAPKEEEGLLDIEEAPVKSYYSDEEIWHVITTETNQGPDPCPTNSQKFHKNIKKKCRLFGNID